MVHLLQEGRGGDKSKFGRRCPAIYFVFGTCNNNDEDVDVVVPPSNEEQDEDAKSFSLLPIGRVVGTVQRVCANGFSNRSSTPTRPQSLSWTAACGTHVCCLCFNGYRLPNFECLIIMYIRQIQFSPTARSTGIGKWRERDKSKGGRIGESFPSAER